MSDLDDTLLGDDEALRRFAALIDRRTDVAFAVNSSRPIASVQATLQALPVPLRPLALITAMGTEIILRNQRVEAWTTRFQGWDRAPLDTAMQRSGFTRHRDEYQTPYKASFTVSATERDRAAAAVRATGVPTRIIFSGRSNMDVLPEDAGKGPTTLFLADTLGVPQSRLIVAGDSENDLDLFALTDHGIVVGNADQGLRSRVEPRRAYCAQALHAAGVLEGLAHWGVIGKES